MKPQKTILAHEAVTQNAQNLYLPEGMCQLYSIQNGKIDYIEKLQGKYSMQWIAVGQDFPDGIGVSPFCPLRIVEATAPQFDPFVDVWTADRLRSVNFNYCLDILDLGWIDYWYWLDTDYPPFDFQA